MIAGHVSIRYGFSLPIFAAPGGRLFRTPNYAALDAQTTMALARHADVEQARVNAKLAASKVKPRKA